jgi:periplasmic divalent cation tolerance protein
MTDYLQVQTTVGSRGDADRLAEALVQGRLAACVQLVGPIRSVYRWLEQIETESEWLCVIKTKRSCYAQVERLLLKLHPYEEPEILALPIVDGSAGYLAWLDDQIGVIG